MASPIVEKQRCPECGRVQWLYIDVETGETWIKHPKPRQKAGAK